MFIIRTPSSYPFGLDISDFTLRLVQLNRKGHYPIIQTLSRIEVPEGYIRNGEIKNEEGVLKIMDELTKKTIFGKLSSKEVVTCLPEAKTFVKLLKITTEEKLTNELVEEEIKKNIPFSIDAVYYDWQLISKKGKEREILIGVVQKSIARQYYNFLKDAGFYPVAFELEPIAICRSLFPVFSSYYSQRKKKDLPEKTEIVIDVGATRSSFIAYSEGTILFTVSLPISNRIVTETIARKLKIDFTKAEAAKIIYGLDKNVAMGVVAKALEKMIDELIDKIKRAISYLVANYPEYRDLNCIYLCGGGAQVKGIDEMLAKKLKIKTKLADVFVNLKVGSKTENKYLSEEFTISQKESKKDYKIKQNFSLTFATAVGLALRGVYVDDI